jgi:glutathione peroxidase-family protein
MAKNNTPIPPLYQLADPLVTETKRLIQSAQTEEELKIGFEKILEPVLKSVGIETKPLYERLSAEAKMSIVKESLELNLNKFFL